jgi:hypothetical protein
MKKTRNIYSIIVILISLLIIIFLVVFIIFLLTDKTAKNTNTSSTSSSSVPQTTYSVLPPATLPAKVPECSSPITTEANGSVTPLQCPNGALNETAWSSLSAIEPKVMTLGYSPTLDQVTAALCSDVTAANADSTTKISVPIEQDIYQISALYYGWDFSNDPSQVLTDNGC